MYKNKKGFTLIEILAVLVILAIISLVAVPNVVSMLDRNKKKQMVLDAKEMLNKFQNKLTLGKCDENSNKCIFTFDELGLDGKEDGYGDLYTEGSVTYNKNDRKYVIVLKTDNHCFASDNKCTSLTTKDSEDFNPTIDNVYEIEKSNNN